MAEKIRVHTLAKELNVPSKVIIEKCRAEGLEVANHMSTLSLGLEATVREWFSEGRHATTVETAARVDLSKVRIKRKKKKKPAPVQETLVAERSGAATTVEATPPSLEEQAATVAAEPDAGQAAVARKEGSETVITTIEQETLPAEASDQGIAVAEAGPIAEAPTEAGGPVATPTPIEAGDEKPDVRIAAEFTPQPPVVAPPVEPPAPPEPILPAGPQNVPKPARLKGPQVVRYEPLKPSEGVFPRRPRSAASALPAAADAGVDGTAGSETDVQRRGRRRSHLSESEAAKAGRGRRSTRRGAGTESADEQLREWRDRDLAERQERISDATGRRIHTRRAVEAPTRGKGPIHPPPKTEATVQEPVILKDLCAATGVSMVQMLPVLRRDCGIIGSINLELANDVAEYVAASFGITLTIAPAKTELDMIEEEFANRKSKVLKPRPPVVTFLGHVDHGKTSLLDAIRATHVTDDEDGGITQHIGAYRLQHRSGSVTFLDTPGHEAFTAMRARGAQLTDIAVLVVAADDGVMPQTIEAINHAKAAGVSVVVALNKIDLGPRNVTKIYGQLTEQGLTPGGEWGGEIDVIHTSATTGQGIDALVEHLVALGEVLDLRADYKGEASGAVIEAEMKEGVGPVVRVLVQQGTLRSGTILICGNAYGKVRALLDDRGKRVKEAVPSDAVEVWGLDEVPAAGDRFYQVKSMQRAKTVAEDSRRRRVHEGRSHTQRARSLEEIFQKRDAEEIPELNVILKADVDGSIEALRTMLGKLPSEKVRLNIRHAAVGAVTDSDVLLADASNAIVIAYRVLAAAGAGRLADEKGVDIRYYKVVYEVSDDIKKALEGLLAPDEIMETRGSCEVRDVFRISKVGAVAGCYVVDGLVHRNHLVRLTRDGTVVRDRGKIASLRRFKDDVREVRSGMECGIRIEGFDDVKPGDVIEVFEIVKVAQTL